eukprot:GHRQ01007767.1.p1 GENE.GHRQ01007767.1~~GHRQ01007767.1.p1  ORF type:complete len:287 (+),score=72.61 GHRQ01007767.1:345-1205(+)
MGAGVCINFVSPQPGVRVLAYDLATGLPTLAFLAFLAWGLKPSLRKLQRSRSHIMATYYGFLWGITGLNFFRCILQMVQTGSNHATSWNVLWLLTRFGMIALEASVVVYLLQGYVSSGRQALLNTLVVSGSAALLETLVKVLYIFALHVPLFLYDPTGDMRWSKWSFWLLHGLAAMLCYTALLVLPFTQWRDLLPAKASFYKYAVCMLMLYTTVTVGSILVGSKLMAGYCVFGVASWLYYASYPVLVYVTFLAEFFADEQLDIDLLYYSEMREAGCFDDAYDDSFG